jgi:hypothetical protein
MTTRRRVVTGVVIVALLAVMLVGQGVSDSLAPTGRAPSGRSVGRASFAFLGGLRTFAAAVLWSRLDPQYHEYFGESVDRLLFTLPTVHLVIALDPQFEQAYFVASFMLARAGHQAEGMQLARDGVAANPDSGTLIASLAQMVLVFDKDAKAAAVVADTAFRPGVRWATPTDEWESMAILRDTYKNAGETAKYQFVLARMKALDKIIGPVKPQTTPTEHLPDINYSK